MRWLVTGAHGQLGSDLMDALAGTPDEVVGVNRAQLDISDSAQVTRMIAEIAPDMVINAAAYTAVDAAESDERRAYLTNATGAAVLANAVAVRGGQLIHLSTDYVFDGAQTRPYEVDDPTNPTSAYGRTKLAGEQAVRELLPDRSFVVRTAWVYGAVGANFVKTMARLEGERETVKVVDDQRGSPTWSADLARALARLGRSGAPAGIYHCTNTGETTWFGLARAVFEELGADPDRVHPTSTEAFPRPAPRPAYSVLADTAWRAAALPVLPTWRQALQAAFACVGADLRPSAE